MAQRYEHLYVLDEDGRTPVPCPDAESWGLWMWRKDDYHRRVAWDVLLGVRVSTVFIGIHSNVFGPPRVFETDVERAGEHATWKHTTWDEALRFHRAYVDTLVKLGALAEGFGLVELADYEPVFAPETWIVATATSDTVYEMALTAAPGVGCVLRTTSPVMEGEVVRVDEDSKRAVVDEWRRL